MELLQSVISYLSSYVQHRIHHGPHCNCRDTLHQISEIASVVAAFHRIREGLEYVPPFDYFGDQRDRGAFRVIESDDVSVDEGTGLVHMAPAYGEADFYALNAAGLDVMVDPVDAEARFTEEVPDVAGRNVKDADASFRRPRSWRESGSSALHVIRLSRFLQTVYPEARRSQRRQLPVSQPPLRRAAMASAIAMSSATLP